MERIVPERVFQHIQQRAEQGELQPLQGDCAEIALALDQVFGTRYGAEIQGVFRPEDPTPVHCAVVLSDGTLIDGKGLRTQQELIEEFDDISAELSVRTMVRSELERQYAIDWSLYEQLVDKIESLHQTAISEEETA